MMRGGTAGRRHAEHARARREAVRLRGIFRGKNDGGGAVVDAGCIAGRDGAGIAHDRFELLQIVERSVGPRMLVLVDGDRPRFAAWRRDRHDLFGEIAGGDSLAGALLRAQREGVLIGARDLEFLGDVLAGLGHRVDAVLRFEHRIDEAPAERGVVDFRRAGECLAGLAHDEGRARHRFDAARDGEVHFAAADGARGVADRIEPGGAQPVDSDAGDFVGQAGQQQRHAGDIAVVLAGLIGAAENDFVEPRPVGLGVAGNQRLDRNRGEIVGADLGERAAVAADRCARGIADEHLPHRSTP